MYGCTNCQQQLEFVYRVFVITAKSETPDLEQRLKIQEYSERDLGVVIVIVVRVPGLLIVFEAHSRGGNAICQNHEHHHHAKLR